MVKERAITAHGAAYDRRHGEDEDCPRRRFAPRGQSVCPRMWCEPRIVQASLPLSFWQCLLPQPTANPYQEASASSGIKIGVPPHELERAVELQPRSVDAHNRAREIARPDQATSIRLAVLPARRH